MAYIFPEKIFPNALTYYLQCPFKFKCHNDKEIKAEFVESPESFVGKVMHMVSILGPGYSKMVGAKSTGLLRKE